MVATIEQVVGTNLRRLRDERGWRQDDVARRVGVLGVPWTPPVVASIEAGTRQVHLGELVLAAAALRTSLIDLLAGEGSVSLGGVTVELATFRAALCDPAGSDDLRAAATEHLSRQSRPDTLEARLVAAGAIGEPEYRAGRHLGVAPVVVADYARQIWGRWFHVERDARVVERYGDDLSPRTLQAARGHVTRDLLTELRARIEADQAAAEEEETRHGKRGQDEQRVAGEVAHPRRRK